MNRSPSAAPWLSSSFSRSLRWSAVRRSRHDANGIAVCTAPGDQLTPVVVSDGAGGSIVAWHDLRPTVPPAACASRSA
jgi:hypothetical protein